MELIEEKDTSGQDHNLTDISSNYLDGWRLASAKFEEELRLLAKFAIHSEKVATEPPLALKEETNGNSRYLHRRRFNNLLYHRRSKEKIHEKRDHSRLWPCPPCAALAYPQP